MYLKIKYYYCPVFGWSFEFLSLAEKKVCLDDKLYLLCGQLGDF